MPEPMAMPRSKASMSPAPVSGSATRGMALRSASDSPCTSATFERSPTLAITWPFTTGSARVTPGIASIRATASG